MERILEKPKLLSSGIIFIGLNVIDAVITQMSLRLGVADEANPLMQMLGANTLVKMSLALAFFVAIIAVVPRPQKIMNILNIAMMVIVIWNSVWFIIGTRLVG